MRAPRALVATRHDAGERVAFQEDHLARQSAVPVDPAPYRAWINIPERLRAHRAGDRASVSIRHPGGVEAEARAPGRADAVTRDQSEHQRAAGQALAIDDNALARRAHNGEGLQVMADLTATVFGDA